MERLRHGSQGASATGGDGEPPGPVWLATTYVNGEGVSFPMSSRPRRDIIDPIPRRLPGLRDAKLLRLPVFAYVNLFRSPRERIDCRCPSG